MNWSLSRISRSFILLMTLLLAVTSLAEHVLLRREANEQWKALLHQVMGEHSERLMQRLDQADVRLIALQSLFHLDQPVSEKALRSARHALEMDSDPFRSLDVALAVQLKGTDFRVLYGSPLDPLLHPGADTPNPFHFPIAFALQNQRVTPTSPILVDNAWISYLLIPVMHQKQHGMLIQGLPLSGLIDEITSTLPEGIELRLSIATPQRGEPVSKVVLDTLREDAAERYTEQKFKLDAEWRFHWQADAEALGGPNFRPANVVLGGGLLASALCALMLLSLMRHTQRESQQRAERERMMQSLRESDERFRELVHDMPATVYRRLSQAGWPMLYASGHFERLTGYPADHFTAPHQSPLLEVIHSDDRERVVAEANQAIETGQPYSLTYRLRHANKGLRWVRDVGHARYRDDGTPLSQDGVIFDISLHHHTEEMLRQAQQRLSALIDHLDIAVIDINLGFFIQSWNPAAETLFGYSGFDVIGKSLIEALIPEDHRPVAGDILEAFASGKKTREMLIVQHRSGKRLNCEWYGTPLRDEGDMVFGVTLALVDVTERAEHQEALQRAQTELERRVQDRTEALQRANRELESAMKQLVDSEALASLGSMVAGVAHELNTPLGNAYTAITGLKAETATLRDHYGRQTLDEAAFHHFLLHAEDATAILERAIERSVDLTRHFKRLAVDQSSVRRRVFDVEESIEGVLTTLRPTLKRSPHRVVVSVLDNLSMDSYPGPFDQIVTNLIMNALQHAFERTPSGEIHLLARPLDAQFIELRCSDNGSGMSTEIAERVFEPFFSTKVGQGGSGLGMYIIQTLIIDIMGGTIELDTTLGKGSTFTLRLPRVAPLANGTLRDDEAQDRPVHDG